MSRHKGSPLQHVQRKGHFACSTATDVEFSAGVEQADDPAQGRRMLDEALDLRGNFYFGAVGPCCVGCAAWHRVFNLLPRWALTAACLSLVGTYTPWAFGQSLANLKSWGGAPLMPSPIGAYATIRLLKMLA